MDVLSTSHPAQEVVFVKGAQIGGTECGNNWIGFVIDRAPGPMLAVQPTVEMAKRNSRQKIEPLIEETACLNQKVADPRSRDSGNTMLAKEFPGGVLVMTGANSAVGLRSMSARYLFLDEVDAYPDDVDGEGDPIDLAKARTRTFARRKILQVSTPTIDGRSKIARSFEQSSRQRFHVACPFCNKRQIIAWNRIKYDVAADKSVIPSSVGLECEHCGKKIPEHHKTDMLASGKWIPENPEETNCIGFHLSSLYSPLGWYSWLQAAEDYERAKANPDKLRTFTNTVLGETWREKGDAPEWDRLYERRERYQLRQVPAGGLVLTAGCDVQKDRLEVEVVAWGRDRQSWSIEYRVIPGDTLTPAPWDELTRLLETAFPHELGGELSIRMLGIDSGYNTSTVYKYVRRFPASRVIACKGQDGLATAIGQPRSVEIKRNGKRVGAGIKVWPVGVSQLKTELYSWLRLPVPVDGEAFAPCSCHFPEYGPEYFQMLTAEELVVRIVRGYRRYQWEKIRERNEALDCRVYARAVSMVLGIDRWPDSVWDDLASSLGCKVEAPRVPEPKTHELKPESKQKPSQPTLQRKRSSYW